LALPLVIGGVDGFHLDAKDGLDGLLDLGLVASIATWKTTALLSTPWSPFR
jgi:hypothetical protein